MKIVPNRQNKSLHQIIKQGLSSFFALFLIVSCAEDQVYMNSLNGIWYKNKVQSFTFEIDNYQTPQNIIFVVRNNNDYPYNNIRFFAVLKQDIDKNTKVDTLNYILAKPNGEWLGSGFGDTKEILFQYKNEYLFPKNGKYTIEVKQAMRADTLKGIEDIGVLVQSAK